jgi:hypothetical protein
MDGVGLARWVRQHRPETKIILTSGYVGALEGAADICDEGPIPKPYEHPAIVEHIHQRLADISARRTRSQPLK